MGAAVQDASEVMRRVGPSLALERSAMGAAVPQRTRKGAVRPVFFKRFGVGQSPRRAINGFEAGH